MHNPANAMAIDMSTANPALPQTQPGEGPPSTTPQEDPNAGPLVAIQNMLTTLAARVEQVAAMVEGPNNRTHPSRGKVSTAAQATPPTVPLGPPPGNRPPRVDIPRQSTLTMVSYKWNHRAGPGIMSRPMGLHSKWKPEPPQPNQRQLKVRPSQVGQQQGTPPPSAFPQTQKSLC